MPPGPVGVGSEYVRIAAEVEHLCNELSASHLIEPSVIRTVIRHLHRTTELSIPEIIADGGCHQLHALLWQLREGEIGVGHLE